MSFGNRIYIFIAAFLILSIYFLALPEKGYSGVGPIIGCCQYIDGEGGDQCLNLTGGGDEECPSIIEGEFVGFFEGETCSAETELCSGFAVNVPTISEWGLIATAGILGLISFMIMRRRRVKAWD